MRTFKNQIHYNLAMKLRLGRDFLCGALLSKKVCFSACGTYGIAPRKLRATLPPSVTAAAAAAHSPSPSPLQEQISLLRSLPQKRWQQRRRRRRRYSAIPLPRAYHTRAHTCPVAVWSCKWNDFLMFHRNINSRVDDGVIVLGDSGQLEPI